MQPYPPCNGDSVSPVLVNGRRVGVWRFGTPGGWPLVWCHGGLSCGLDAKVVDLAGRRGGVDVISLDRPGIGRSDPMRMSTVGQWPNTVERVADLLDISEFAIAGWSGGGPYALACGAAMPERVRAIATIAGMAPLERARHIFELGLWADRLLIPTARWLPGLAGALLRLNQRLPDNYLAWEARRAAVDSEDRAALASASPWLLAAIREATSGAVSGMVDEYRRYYGDWGFDLGGVRQPVTIWQGEQDTWVPLSHARRLARALPSGTLRLVPSTGHLLPLGFADEILEDLVP